jgi:acetylornithine aminotransferase
MEGLIRKNLVLDANVSEIRGTGLLLGIVLTSDRAKAVEKLCLDMGLIINAVRPNVIRLAPPLNVNDLQVISAMDILSSAIAKVGSND